MDLYTAVIEQTDFLTDLPAYKDATDAKVEHTVDVYLEVVEDLADYSARLRLIARAWSEMERINDQRIEANERAERPSLPEYSTYANAN